MCISLHSETLFLHGYNTQHKDQVIDGLPAILYLRDLYFSTFVQLLKCRKLFIHTEVMSPSLNWVFQFVFGLDLFPMQGSSRPGFGNIHPLTQGAVIPFYKEQLLPDAGNVYYLIEGTLTLW